MRTMKKEAPPHAEQVQEAGEDHESRRARRGVREEGGDPAGGGAGVRGGGQEEKGKRKAVGASPAPEAILLTDGNIAEALEQLKKGLGEDPSNQVLMATVYIASQTLVRRGIPRPIIDHVVESANFYVRSPARSPAKKN